MSDRTVFDTYHFALLVVRNPDTGKFLIVNESRKRGLWLPGGGVDAGESFQVGARRECWEEAGCDVKIKGVLRVEHSLTSSDSARMRVIFYAEPKDPKAPIKQHADEHSEGAMWLSVEEIEARKRELRGREPLEWALYLRDKGAVWPLSILAEEMDEVEVKGYGFTVSTRPADTKESCAAAGGGAGAAGAAAAAAFPVPSLAVTPPPKGK